MDTCLDLNGVEIARDTDEMGQIIIRCAHEMIEDGDLPDWLRGKAGA